MPIRTHLKAEVPIARATEAIGYFGEITPGEEVLGSHRLGTDVVWMEVIVPGDSEGALEAKLREIDTHGIKFTVHTTPY